ncbi:O-antigen ligase family protein [Roseibium marinum]|uniref:O-antigen ligase n=1 Tax=Roseibium marinum TaxID=281252 RepID=A0A2S3V2Z9_9HYPH|nr:O-antigen ligase [Roseibium marinum]POF34316.1 O-antigen ligase [Roseibium marinum]
MYSTTPIPPMHSVHTGVRTRGRSGGWILTAALFLGVFFYFWIGLAPFPNPNAANLTTPYGGSSNRFNQIVVALMSGILLFVVFGKSNRRFLLCPHGLLLAILAWFAFASLFAGDPGTAFRRIVFAILVCSCGSAILLLPRSREQFTTLICIALTAVIGIAYYGVVALPHLAIHQFTDALEQQLAGDWRGHMGHKNVAAAAMVFAIFFGLYISRVKSTLLGSMIVIAATLFLWKSGSKTSFAMLPLILLLSWIFERVRFLRPVIVIGGLVVVNTLLMSAAVSESIQQLLASAGVDPTFTDRTSIWAIALNAIERSPITGYGYQSFWQTEALFRSGYSLQSWAVTAANAHNGYLEQFINAGIPGFLLVVTWLVFLPIRYANKAFAGGNDQLLTRLFLRIWLFSLFFSCLESPFFGNAGPVWFTMLMGVFGLRLQAYAHLVAADPGKAATGAQSALATNPH